MQYLKMIRPLNLTMIAFVQGIVKFGFLDRLYIETAVDNTTYFILILATVLIAAGGNVINDLNDIETDRINKPQKVSIGVKISEKAAFYFYLTLTFIGVCAGFYVANKCGLPQFAVLFIGIAGLLHLYAVRFKNYLIISNVLVSLLVASSILIIIPFYFTPLKVDILMRLKWEAILVLLLFSGFAFYINLIREIVKDILDIDGDKNDGRNTLPILLGKKRTRNISFVLTTLLALGLMWYTYIYLYSYTYVSLYFLFAIIAPLLIVCAKLWTATTDKEFRHISSFLKVIMFLGILAILFYTEILANYIYVV